MATQLKNKRGPLPVRVMFSAAQMVVASNTQDFDTHRDFIAHLFKEKKFVVINFAELRYYWFGDPKGDARKLICKVEGDRGVAVMSM
jgi:hypothetical protein